MASRSARQPQDLMRLLTRAERLAARRLEAVLDEDGCSLDAWRVLVLLSDGEGHHMTAVAEAAFLPPATLTKLVDQLVDQNLVHRRVDPWTGGASSPISPPAARRTGAVSTARSARGARS